MCLDEWHCTARVEDADGPIAVPAIGLRPPPGTPGPIERFTTDGLDVGWYRLAQEANEGVVAAAIFEVAEGAQPLPPLVPIDAPAISVSPALLSPDGGAVSLYPPIPANGSQSREDVQRATEGLSETAQLERWDGSAWEAVAEVELNAEDGGELARSARLPSLLPGDYRLVREGPDTTHVGHLWVVEPVRGRDGREEKEGGVKAARRGGRGKGGKGEGGRGRREGGEGGGGGADRSRRASLQAPPIPVLGRRSPRARGTGRRPSRSPRRRGRIRAVVSVL